MPTRTWTWTFDKPPAALWPILADTARFNEALGVPTYQVEMVPQADGTVRRTARTRLGGRELVWDEQPYEWVEGRWFRHVRIFERGPFRRFGPALTLEPTEGGSRVTYSLSAEPMGLIGRLLLATGVLDRIGRSIERTLRAAAAVERPLGLTNLKPLPPRLAEGAEARLPGIVAALESGPYGHGLAQRLVDHVCGAQEVDLLHLRPLRLARLWDVPPQQVVELCLAAVPAGLLSMHWDLLCPRCRGASLQCEGLDQLPGDVHCPSCNVDFRRDFARNLELSFTPAAPIRPVLAGEYCLSGPMITPHVRVQQRLGPGETRQVEAGLPAGSYRLRTLEPGGSLDVELDDGPPPTVIAESGTIRLGPPSADGRLHLENREATLRGLVIEDRDWVADALTAHRAVTIQAFRDLFAGQAPRPGDEMGVESVTLLFSDLRGSTALYEALGDSAAFAAVREHFAFLTATIREQRGAVVKTIGDAVMAAFPQPPDALQAALRIQAGIAAFNEQLARTLPIRTGLVIKLGLHGGPAIVVRLNERLDYFGSTVNLAARVETASDGGDIVLSGRLAADPQVAPLLAGLPNRTEVVRLKGFDAPVTIRRILPADAAARPAA